MDKMKSFLGTLSFIAAACLFSPSQAHVIKTYLSEKFNDTLSEEVWDLDACTLISEEEGYLYYMNIGETDSRAGGWIYDPAGLIIPGNTQPTPLNGTYSLVSKPVQLDNDINLVYVDYRYYANFAGGHSFGIRIKEEKDSEWTFLRTLSLGTLSEGKLVAILDPQWAGKKVNMEVYFQATHQNGISYYFMMKEINFSSYNEDLSVSSNLSAFPIFYGETFEFELSTVNTSAVSVNSVEYVYTIDDHVKTGTIPLTFTPALAPMNGTDTRPVQIDVQGLSFGHHTLKILPPSSINGEPVTSDTPSLELEFTLIDKALLTQDYVPLMECFTASWCSPCATMNKFLNPTLEELKGEGNINVVKYQAYGDKYYITAYNDRCAVYSDFEDYGYIPFPIYNAEANITSWSGNHNVMMGLLKRKAKEDHSRKALVSININKAEADTKTKLLELNFSIESSFSGESSIFAVITEKTTTKNSGGNGEKEFHYVAMDLPTTGAGELVDFEANKAKDFNYTVNLAQTNMEEITDLEVVCFVQDLATKKIFQSTSADVTVLNVANEQNEASRIKMYPNPARNQVVLQGISHADITFYDLTGRMVYAVKGVEESLNINLEAFTSGIYMVLINQNGQTSYKKLVVEK